MPSMWLFLLWTSTLPPLPLLTLCLTLQINLPPSSLPLELQKESISPSDSRTGLCELPLISVWPALFWQLTNDTDFLVNNDTLLHTRVIAAQPQVWCIRDPRHKRWHLCCLERGQIARMSAWTPDLWPCSGSLTTSDVHSIGFVTTEHNNTTLKPQQHGRWDFCFRKHLDYLLADLTSRNADRRRHWT